MIHIHQESINSNIVTIETVNETLPLHIEDTLQATTEFENALSSVNETELAINITEVYISYLIGIAESYFDQTVDEVSGLQERHSNHFYDNIKRNIPLINEEVLNRKMTKNIVVAGIQPYTNFFCITQNMFVLENVFPGGERYPVSLRLLNNI